MCAARTSALIENSAQKIEYDPCRQLGRHLCWVIHRRYFYKIKLSGSTTFLGVISLIGGVMQLLGMPTLEGAIVLIVLVLGGYLILKPWFEKRQLFGKVEES